MPTTTATADMGDGLKLEADGRLTKGGLPAKAEDVALRTDLPKSHPLYGTRAVRAVLSGMGDMVVGADSRLEPAVKAVEAPLEEPKEEPTEVVR